MKPDENPEMQQYDKEASAYCEAAIFIWCIAGSMQQFVGTSYFYRAY